MATEPASRQVDSPLAETYARKATGMVREVRLFDMIAFNASASTPVGIVLALSIFVVFAAFPGANLVLDLALDFALLPFIWVTFSLLASTLPGVGGDYLYGSRILHPVAGVFSNLCGFANAMLSIGLAAYLWVQAGIVAMLGIIGSVTGSKAWISAAHTLSSKGWTFALGSALVIVVSLISVAGTKAIARTMAYAYYAALISTVISILVLLFTSRHHFVSVINDIGLPFTHNHHTYSNTVSAGAKAGLVYPDHGGYSATNTLGSMFTVMLALNATFYGIYLTGEMKGAGRRGRQLLAMGGTGYAQLIIVFVGVIAFVHAAGYNFLAAASNGAFPVPVAPFFNFFAFAVVGNHVLPVVLGFLFLLAFPPLVYGNMALCQRTPFVWAFDGLLPHRIARVNPRTHTPVLAIFIIMILGLACTAFASFSATFIEVMTYTGVLGIGTFVMAGIYAMTLRRRRPAIYNGSPADWRIGGVPILPIAGAGCTAIGFFFFYLLMRFHKNLGVVHVIVPILVLVGTALLSFALYFGARAVQRGRGVDIELAYHSLPID